MFNRFDTIPACAELTDGQTDGLNRHINIGRCIHDYTRARDKNWQLV